MPVPDRLRPVGGHRGEEGFTAVELIVVTLILGLVLGIVFSALISVQNTVNHTDLRSQTNDQLRVAEEEILRQVRSGNLLYNPANEGDNAKPPASPTGTIPPGFSMRIFTQANGSLRCVQWRVLNQVLQTRSWAQSWSSGGTVSSWRNVSDHIVNPTATPPFALDPAAGFAGRLIDIDLVGNESAAAGSNVEEKASVTGRNTEFGYDPTVCNSIPPA